MPSQQDPTISSTNYDQEKIACHECDLLVQLPQVKAGTKALCPRCGYVLTSLYKNAQQRIIAFASAGLVFLLCATSFPFIVFSAQGQERVVNLMASINVLVSEDQVAIAALILAAIVVLPACFLMGLLYVLIPLKHDIVAPQSIRVLRLVTTLTPWSMVEIFMIGVLVSLIKIASMADVTFGLSFWAYCLFSLCMTVTLLHIDKIQLWHWVETTQQRY